MLEFLGHLPHLVSHHVTAHHLDNGRSFSRPSPLAVDAS